MLCTRSVKVSRFVNLIYWGLDTHLEHHYFPSVPSYNLSKLHTILQDKIPEARNVWGCWKEMSAIAKEKDKFPNHEFVPVAKGKI